MRKSERIRLLELEIVRMQYELHHINDLLSMVIDNNFKAPDMDAGKWYQRRPE